MNDSTLNVAIVGTGRMGLQHARVIRAEDAPVRLAAFVDPSTAALEEAARRFPDIPGFPSLAHAIEDAAVDTVHVCTPYRKHFSVADEALRRGCHVFVEKPFTATAAEARRLFETAARAERSVCAGHQLLFEPVYRRLREQLPLVNRCVHVESYFAFAPSAGHPSGRVGLDPETQLLDVLPHPLYLLLDVLRSVAPDGALELCAARLGEGGTIHALLRRGPIQATLVVTTSGRPVESTLRVVGTGGELCADFVRGILRQQLGPGRSTIDKIAAPYLQAWQGTTRTTGVLLRRALRRKRDYPSLDELIRRWHAAVHHGAPSPTPEPDVIEVMDVLDAVAGPCRLGCSAYAPRGWEERAGGTPVVVTGGTGWLGRAVTRELSRAGARVTVIARRSPPSWQREPDVDYLAADLSEGVDLTSLAPDACVVHCAAETVGGREAHERNSVRATANLLESMRVAGISRLIHVSSVAVLDTGDGPVSEDTRIQPDPEACGPYVWGKVESEKLVLAARDLERRIVRPAAIVDRAAFDPPGKLGRRVGPLFVAIGGPHEPLGVVDLDRTARAIAWMALHFEQAPETINLLDPVLPTRRELVGRLRAANPTLVTLRMPRPVLWVAGLSLKGVSTLLRPGRPATDLRKVFARQRFVTTKAAALEEVITATAPPVASLDHVHAMN